MSNASSPPASNSNKFVDLNLHIGDLCKSVVLVRNVLDAEAVAHVCDEFNEHECHHAADYRSHLFAIEQQQQHAMSSSVSSQSSSTISTAAAAKEQHVRCTYCRFVDMLCEHHSSVAVATEHAPRLQQQQQQQRVLLRYRKGRYPLEVLDWCEFQPWRAPHLLVGYASCQTQADLLAALRRFGKLKEAYKKTLVDSKLFVDFHAKHEMSKQFLQSVRVGGVAHGALDDSTKSMDLFDSLYAPAAAAAGGSKLLLRNKSTSFLMRTRSVDMRRAASEVFSSLPIGGQDDEPYDDESVGSEDHQSLSNSSIEHHQTSTNDLTSAPVAEQRFNADLGGGDVGDQADDPKARFKSAFTFDSDMASLPYMDESSSSGNMSSLLGTMALEDSTTAAASKTADGQQQQQQQQQLLSASDETELNAKLKSMQKDIVYLDFLFAKTGADKLAALLESERLKVQLAINEFAKLLYDKQHNMATVINPNDDRQINFYAEFLKTPIERTGSGDVHASSSVRHSDATLSSSSLLSIKVISKKIVQGRMYKYKADLMLSVGMFEAAVLHYNKAQTVARKEHDLMWANAALEGLCVASYLYAESRQRARPTGTDVFRASSSLETSSTLSINSNSAVVGSAAGATLASRNPPFKDWRNSLRKTFSTDSTKDVASVMIETSDLPKHFREIISYYNGNSHTNFIALEFALMATRLFAQTSSIDPHMRTAALDFISCAIYISNVQLSEEDKIRRYWEVGDLYERCQMRRLATFYKWISVGRVFKLTDKYSKRSASDPLKCIARRCALILRELFDDMKIWPQKTPALSKHAAAVAAASAGDTNVDGDGHAQRIGFPDAKKNLLGQIIQLFEFNSNYKESSKFIKYLLHEMESHMSLDEFTFYLESFIHIMTSKKHVEMRGDEPFFTKFYKFPALNSFKLASRELGFNRMDTIEQAQSTAPSGIYLYRYQDPRILQRAKIVYSLAIGETNRVEFTFSNPIPIDLHIDTVSLICERAGEYTYYLPLFELVDDDVSAANKVGEKRTLTLSDNRHFIIPSNAKAFRVPLVFMCDQCGPFKIIGYEVKTFKCKNRIMFVELSETQVSQKRNLHRDTDAVQADYDVEMIPRMPVIDDVRLTFYDVNQNAAQQASSAVNNAAATSKTLSISAKLGTRQVFDMAFILAGSSEQLATAVDLDVFELKLIVINEQVASRLSASVCVQQAASGDDSERCGAAALVVDTSAFCSDNRLQQPSEPASESRELLNCQLALKYTNAAGRQRNLCHTLKVQLNIRFQQIILVTLNDIFDVDENKFAIDLTIRNLTDLHVYLKQDVQEPADTVNQEEQQQQRRQTATVQQIEPLCDHQVRITVAKLSVCETLCGVVSGPQADAELMTRINDRLNVKFGIDARETSFVPLRLQQSAKLLQNIHKIFKCPVSLSSQMLLQEEQQTALLADKCLSRLYMLLIIGQQQQPLNEMSNVGSDSGRSVLFRLRRSKSLCVCPNVYEWESKLSEQNWVKEYNLLSSEDLSLRIPSANDLSIEERSAMLLEAE